MVPRANLLADVAAKEVIAHHRGLLRRVAALELDGQVRDAPTRIQHVQFDEGGCGTGIQTARARAAVIRRERRVRRQLEVEEERAEEEE